jgi:hypothetical protein
MEKNCASGSALSVNLNTTAVGKARKNNFVIPAKAGIPFP